MARLRDAEGLERSLQKLLSRYFTPNLFSIHPKISDKGSFGCESCFWDENDIISDEWKRKFDLRRGMVTDAKGAFQFDGNAGLLAAVHEMLLQSHIPQMISFLPAVTSSLRDSGIVRRLKARGNVSVSFQWENGEVRAATIAIHSWHPAFRPFKEQSRGFFGVEQSVSGASVPLIFAFPNPMKAIMLSDAASVYDTVNSKDKLESYFSQCSESCEVHSSYPRQKGDTFYNLWLPMRSKLSHYPIRLQLCHRTSTLHDCRRRIDVLATSPDVSPSDKDIGLGED